MRWMAAARSSLCSGLPAGAEIKWPSSGLNEFSVITDMQPAVLSGEPPHAERLPRDSRTAPPMTALREKRRRVELSAAGPASADAFCVSALPLCCSSKLSKSTPKHRLSLTHCRWQLTHPDGVELSTLCSRLYHCDAAADREFPTDCDPNHKDPNTPGCC